LGDFPILSEFRLKMRTHKVSAVIITYNEENIILQTLDALSWCDEILIVDSGSTDRTVNLCESRGCRILNRPFSGYGEQKQYAVQEAKYDWILSLDADEVLTDELINEIVAVFTHKDIPWSGFYLPRTLVFMAKPFTFGKEHNQPCLRLFNRRAGGYTDARVHEHVELTGVTKNLKAPMLHYSYRNIEHYFAKFNRYTSLAATQLYERGQSVNRLAILFRLPLTFIQTYFFKGNFMNGYPGLVWSLFCGLYPVVKYLKLYERACNRVNEPPTDGRQLE
jgi:glycosyltransferase involved in cell wall biosynthesis